MTQVFGKWSFLQKQLTTEINVRHSDDLSPPIPREKQIILLFLELVPKVFSFFIIEFLDALSLLLNARFFGFLKISQILFKFWKSWIFSCCVITTTKGV